MDNQHRKIKGYRELTQADIDLMNEVKAFGPQLEALTEKVNAHVKQQRELLALAKASVGVDAGPETARLNAAQPERWAAIGKTDLQTGLMALTRAIAQPGFF